MQIIESDIWDFNWDMLFFTSNSQITKTNRLVMGKGFAAEVKDKYPDIPALAGAKIIELNKQSDEYGCILLNNSIGLFQIKVHYSNNAFVGLIKTSALALSKIATKNFNIKIALNFPEMGYLIYRRDAVLVELQILPDNVYVFKKPEWK